MRFVASIGSICVLVLANLAFGQTGLDPAKLLQQPRDTWPTYNGDYTGRRFSPPTTINTSNVRSLSLAWAYRIDSHGGYSGRISSTSLEVDGVLCFTVPNRVWAVDARTGQQIWTYTWQSRIDAIGNCGAGIAVCV